MGNEQSSTGSVPRLLARFTESFVPRTDNYMLNRLVNWAAEQNRTPTARVLDTTDYGEELTNAIGYTSYDHRTSRAGSNAVCTGYSYNNINSSSSGNNNNNNNNKNIDNRSSINNIRNDLPHHHHAYHHHIESEISGGVGNGNGGNNYFNNRTLNDTNDVEVVSLDDADADDDDGNEGGDDNYNEDVDDNDDDNNKNSSYNNNNNNKNHHLNNTSNIHDDVMANHEGDDDDDDDDVQIIAEYPATRSATTTTTTTTQEGGEALSVGSTFGLSEKYPTRGSKRPPVLKPQRDRSRIAAYHRVPDVNMKMNRGTFLSILRRSMPTLYAPRTVQFKRPIPRKFIATTPTRTGAIENGTSCRRPDSVEPLHTIVDLTRPGTTKSLATQTKSWDFPDENEDVEAANEQQQQQRLQQQQQQQQQSHLDNSCDMSQTLSSIGHYPAAAAVAASAVSPRLVAANDTWLQEFQKDLAKLELDRSRETDVKRRRVVELAENRQKLQSRLLRPTPAEVPPQTPPLTADIEARIKKALYVRDTSAVLVEKFKLRITRGDLQKLEGHSWLNDSIINFYFALLADRSETNTALPAVYSFSSFFYERLRSDGYGGVQRWTRRVDVFAKDLLLVPVHLDVHWCLAVIDLRRSRIEYYDSMGAGNDRCLGHLLSWLQEESRDKRKTALDVSGWTTVNRKDVPQQQNGSDCGMFACRFAEYVTRRARINFTQRDMDYFRRRTMYEVLEGRLL